MALLEVKHASKNFGGLKALSNVSFDVSEGEILTLIGPNGAGKTTMFHVISGYYRPDHGKVIFRQQDITGLPPSRICRLGLCRTFQIVQPFHGMTVLDNVTVGAFARCSSTQKARALAETIVEETDLGHVKDLSAENLNIATWKRLEVAKALATGPRLLLLDEVLAGLNPTEVVEALELIRGIRDKGITIMMVEHVMQAVMSLSDRIVVLNNGCNLAEGTPEEVTRNPVVVDAYLGEETESEALRWPSVPEDRA